MRKHFLTSLKGEQGTAIFAAIMLLVLAGGLGLLAFHVSTSELQISTYTGRDLASTYLAESGVEKVFSWVVNPARSPDAPFFSGLPARRCSAERTTPDFQFSADLINNPSGPFSELEEVGRVIDLRLYKPSHPDGFCTIESRGVSGKGGEKVIRVEISRNPLPPITAGIQGFGETGISAPVWEHWGPIRYTGNVRLTEHLVQIPVVNPILSPGSHPYTNPGPNEDPITEIRVEKRIEGPAVQSSPNLFENDSTVRLDSMTQDRLNEVKHYIQREGSYYVVSPSGHLEHNGVDRGEFDDVFGNAGDAPAPVWIDVLPGYSSLEPIRLGRNNYRGYFYFSGNVQIQEDQFQTGMTVQARSHPWSATNSHPITLANIRLDGFFYALGSINIQGAFSAYGAFYAGQGFIGSGAEKLQVWYNKDFASAAYSDIPSLVRLKGTWRSIPSDM